jgi:hypothetical protein
MTVHVLGLLDFNDSPISFLLKTLTNLRVASRSVAEKRAVSEKRTQFFEFSMLQQENVYNETKLSGLSLRATAACRPS